jgi:hypothetical protein
VAKFVATDYDISIGGDDFSDSIAAVTFEISAAEQEVTAFGDTFVQRIGGLKDASVSLDFHQDFGASSVDATLEPLIGETVAIVVKPTGEAVSATNPSYTGTFLVTEYTPFASSIGDLATLSVSFPLASGEVVRGVGA